MKTTTLQEDGLLARSRAGGVNSMGGKLVMVTLSFLLTFAFLGVGFAAPKSAYAQGKNDAAQQAQPTRVLTLQATSASPKISKKTMKLGYGKSATLSVTGNNGKKVVWSSTKKGIVTVKSTGKAKAKITAKGSGTATIIAKVGGKKLTCKVTVPFAPKISKTSLKLTYGKSATLSVSGNNGKKVTWSSSNTSVATVKSAGAAKATVTAKKAGKATITAKVGGKTLKCSVNVVGKLSISSMTMTSFDVKQLSLNGAKAKSWTSSDDKCALVNGSGLVYGGKKDGRATITCTDTYGNTYTCEVSNSLPYVTCEIDRTRSQTLGDTTYYYKHFIMDNYSDKTILLSNEWIMYFPYKNDASTYELMIGVPSMYTVGDFGTDPLAVYPGDRVDFDGFEGTYENRYPLYYDRTFAMRLTVEGRDYTCIFSTEGAMLLCSVNLD